MILSTNFQKAHPMLNFTKVLPVEAALIHAHGQSKEKEQALFESMRKSVLKNGTDFG